ncbi:hypothetical protein Msil_3097 [Methylocella silvestris BL2]|uniref:Helix-turn-helix domain-containing protein n=1 Tax=Methylocella silvestris (strain DSM 15510 / CIP 108128 / LMG 27833 / NCIMB 13906 / BL2) TaxID=395965 RepID=B8EKX8_METSB|nr:hypothetical protein [Methylocella silvestris]ACK52006.1 hypothetical protein Msil_3097 [Methylocella silvestris BL2]
MEQQDVYDIEQFCDRHRISKSTYFNLQKAGVGPRVMHVGKRVLITKEAAADWRRAREQATATEAEAAA